MISYSFYTLFKNYIIHPFETTFEGENDETIPFFTILISRKRNNITTTVCRNPSCNYIHLNWNAFAPATWKRGTLKTLVERAYVIWSADQLLVHCKTDSE